MRQPSTASSVSDIKGSKSSITPSKTATSPPVDTLPDAVVPSNRSARSNRRGSMQSQGSIASSAVSSVWTVDNEPMPADDGLLLILEVADL